LARDARIHQNHRALFAARYLMRMLTIVEGEQHYRVRVAIDRFTGQVLDKQIEVANE